MADTKTLRMKMYEIMNVVDFIEKDKKNDFHGYEYASEKIIKETLHKHLTAQKILFRIEVTDAIQQGTLTLLKMRYYFSDAESDEEISGEFMGSGEDKGDKGLYKAITGAIKYILTSSFLIPTGEDPEKDAPLTIAPRTNTTAPNVQIKTMGGDPWDMYEPSIEHSPFDLPPSASETGHGSLMCPSCGSNTKFVPAGHSKKTNRPYKAFYACNDKVCGKTFPSP